METLFLIGTFWFWSLVIVTFVLLSIFVNKKESSGTIATITLITAFGIFFYFGNRELFLDLLTYIKESPLSFIGWIMAYLISGVIWSFFKWHFFLKDLKNEYLENKKRYSNTVLTVPEAKNHKSTIIMWMSYWVVSIYWTFIKQFVTGIWTNIYLRLEGQFNKMSKDVFKDVIEAEAQAEELKKAEKESKK